MKSDWNINSESPITDQCGGATFLIRFFSPWDGITHTDLDEDKDYTVDITWIRNNDGGSVATTGTFYNEAIYAWKKI